MIQHSLSLTHYIPTLGSQLMAEKIVRYKERGPILVSLIDDKLTDPDADLLDTMTEINELSLELSSLNYQWFDFSVEVFAAFFSITPTTLQALKQAFTQAKSKIIHGHTNSPTV